MSDKRHIDLVENLTKDAEKGKDVSEVLNQIPFAERLQIAKEMETANDKHRSADSSLPSLTIDTKGDGAGTEHLLDIKSGGKDVYQLPDAVKGDWKTRWFFDNLVDAQMTRDAEDSKHLKPLSESERSGKFYSGSGSRNK